MIDRILESVTANLEKAAKNVDDKPGGSFTGELVKTYIKGRVERKAYDLESRAERRNRRNNRGPRDRRKGPHAEREPRKRVYGPVERAVRKATGTLGKRKNTFTGKQFKKAMDKASPEARAQMQKDYDSTTPKKK